MTTYPVQSPVTAAVPTKDIEKLLGALRENYGNEKLVTLCNADHGYSSIVRDPYRVSIGYSGEMEEVARDIFVRLQEVARSGKTSGTISLTDPDRVAIQIAVLEVFHREMSLNGLAFGGGEKGHHSMLCPKAIKLPKDLVLEWRVTNPYLNPKPNLSLPSPQPFGIVQLNEERLKGNGDCTLVFGGGFSFSAHLVIVGSFSTVMAERVKKAQDDNSDKVDLSEVKDLSPKALDALMTFMYMQTIDYAKLPITDVIRLLGISNFFRSDALKKSTFDDLFKIHDQLTSQDLLQLGLLQMEQPFDQLKSYCEWLLKIRPNFYEDLLKKKEIPAEELLILYTFYQQFNLEAMKDPLSTVWKGMKTAQKTVFVKAALEKQENLGLLEEIDQLCEDVSQKLDESDPDGDDFDQAFEDLHIRIIQMKNPRRGKNLPKK